MLRRREVENKSFTHAHKTSKLIQIQSRWEIALPKKSPSNGNAKYEVMFESLAKYLIIVPAVKRSDFTTLPLLLSAMLYISLVSFPQG